MDNMKKSECQQPSKNITSPHCNDVLNGRGKFAMKWNGNCFFRELVQSNKSAYLEADDDERIFIAKNIIQIVRSQTPPGRFLKLDSSTNMWNDIRNKKAMRKTRQALRDGSHPMQNKGSTVSSYDKSKHVGTLPSHNHLKFQEKISNKATSSSVEDEEQSKQKSEVLACSTLSSPPNNHLEFKDKITNEVKSSFAEDANQFKQKSKVPACSSLSKLPNDHLEFQDKIPNEATSSSVEDASNFK